MFEFLDAYELKARVAPGLVILAPTAIAIVMLSVSEKIQGLGWLASAGAIAGAFLLATIVRDRGKDIEPKLFKSWGGKPTSVILRRADKILEPLLKTRYLLNLESLVPGFSEPKGEAANLLINAAIYDAAVRWLIEHTNDRIKFPKVFAHNCGYGFRRNLYASRDAGFSSSVIALAIASGMYWVAGVSLLSGVAFSAGLLGLLVFGYLITTEYVRRAAIDYSVHLLAASDLLRSEKNNPKP